MHVILLVVVCNHVRDLEGGEIANKQLRLFFIHLTMAASGLRWLVGWMVACLVEAKRERGTFTLSSSLLACLRPIRRGAPQLAFTNKIERKEILSHPVRPCPVSCCALLPHSIYRELSLSFFLSLFLSFFPSLFLSIRTYDASHKVVSYPSLVRPPELANHAGRQGSLRLVAW